MVADAAYLLPLSVCAAHLLPLSVSFSPGGLLPSPRALAEFVRDCGEGGKRTEDLVNRKTLQRRGTLAGALRALHGR